MRTNSYLAKLREHINKMRERINTLMCHMSCARLRTSSLSQEFTVQTKRKLLGLKVTNIWTVVHITDNGQMSLLVVKFSLM